MNDAHEPVHLNNHHRDTLMAIFQHPVSHNIDWKAVLSLLDAVGSVEESSEDKVRVVVGTEEFVLTKPRHKDIDTQMVVNLRRVLTNAGYGSIARRSADEGKEV